MNGYTPMPTYSDINRVDDGLYDLTMEVRTLQQQVKDLLRRVRELEANDEVEILA